MLLVLTTALAAQAVDGGKSDLGVRDAIQGSVEMVPLGAADDSVPLPVGPIVQPGADGDVVVAQASGDPYFLGFAAGKHYPPAGERIDPALAQFAASLPADGRPADTTFAFVMFQRRITDARVAELEALGVRVLSFHPHYTLKVALSPRALSVVAGLDFVRWVGVARAWQKVHPQLSESLAKSAPGASLELWVNVFDSDMGPDSVRVPVGIGHEADSSGNVSPAPEAARPSIVLSNGWQQRALEALGAEVLEYAEDVRAFRLRLDAARIEELVARDFVQFVELSLAPQALHDESMPLVNADRVRASYDGSTNLAAIAGVIDSGTDFLHLAIDPYIVGWEYSTDATFYWDDQDGHGTHVSGTILGNGDVEDSFQGAAPGLGFDTAHRFFSAKIFNAAGSATGVSFPVVFAQMRTAYTDASNVTTQRPMVINNSWGTPGGPYYGSETLARLIDDTVYDWNQLYVFAAGNSGSGSSTMLLESSSKNALSVGSVVDWDSGSGPGEVASSSSRGPTDDLRWKPNLCAPGNAIWSCEAGTSSGYVVKTGTSMAAPHVTGIAAQLCDHYSFLRYNPACLSAVMMAGSLTRNDVVLTTPSTSGADHLNIYGTGRIDAYKANFGDGEQALYFWSYGQTNAGYGQLDFDVNAGATRVAVVMHYKEESASAGASVALVNDLDMRLDVPPYAAGGNTGDYTAQISPRDNTEVRIINSPATGTWRIKVFPESVVAGQTCKVGVCAIVTYADTTPTPSFSVGTFNAYVNTNEDAAIAAIYSNPSYFASAVFFDSTSSGDLLQDTAITLADGSSAHPTDNGLPQREVCMGNVLHDTTRTAVFTTRWPTEGAKSFSVLASSDNATDVTDSATIYVDDTPPPVPTNLASTTHTPNVWSNDTTIGFQWTQPADNVSGINGYSWTLANTFALPNATQDIGTVVSYLTNFNPLTDTGTWWFNIRPVDKCGNWSPTYARTGPFLLDFVQPDYVTGLASPTHGLGSFSCNPNITITWNTTLDGGGSGLAGYYYNFSHVPSEYPGTTNTIGPVTSFSTTLAPSAQPWYFHITPFDNAGNSQNFFDIGPFYVVAATPQTYCTGKTNSLGCVPAIGSTGAPSKSGGNLIITCANAISQKNGLLFWGAAGSATPFQGGFKCVASPTVRSPVQSSGGSAGGNDCTGTYAFNFSTTYMTSFGIDPGETVFAQWWMRDPASASTTGLSNAVSFTVCE